jgi:apolipoprotein N-acyltransferase
MARNELKSPLRPVWIAFATLTSAAAYFVSTGLGELWPLAWIAPIPVLIVAFHSSARTAAAISFTAYLLGSFNLLSYLAALVPIGVLVGTLVLPAVGFALVVLITRQVVLRAEPWLSVFAFPAAWTSLEWGLAMASPHGTAGSIAYSQTDVLPPLQIASLTGLWGITFLVTLVPAGLAIAWQFRAEKQRAMPAMAACLLVGSLTLGYGWAYLARPAPRPPIRVGLAATDETIRYFRTEQPAEALPVVQAYARRVGRLAAGGARVVVLPEKFMGVTPSYLSDVIAVLREAARANRVMVVAGLNLVGRVPRRNTAVVISPDGEVLVEYDKAYLLPGLEDDYQAGARPGLFPMSDVVWGSRSARTWIFRSGAGPMRGPVRVSSWCRRGTSSAMRGCTPAWRGFAVSRVASRCSARHKKGS